MLNKLNNCLGAIMKNFFAFSILITSLHAMSALPENDLFAADTNYTTIGSVEVTDVTEDIYLSSLENNISVTDILNRKITDLATSSTPIGQGLVQLDLIVDKIINIGQKIWTVIEKGRPAATYNSAKATALPANSTRWDQLENWQHPKVKTIQVVYKNLYGIEVVKFTYRIVLLYGGNVNGVGKYIGYATVEPVEMTTAYLYTFSATASIDAVYNMGTRQNPLAGMILKMNWSIETVLKKSTMTHTFNLDGLGNINSDDTQNLTYLK